MNRGFLYIKLFLTFNFSLLAFHSFSQDYWQEKVYSPVIKSVKLEVEGTDFTMPILRLGSSQKIKLSFDELEEQTKRYNYTIIHCNANWTQSELQPQEYIQGFESGYIENFSNSFNTIQRFVHYSQSFPNSMMSFKVSGNYVIKVYEDDNTDKVVMVRRFMVVEDEAYIRADLMMGRNPSEQKTKQEIDVFVKPTSNMSFADPSRYIKVFVQQNGNRDNISLLKQRQIKSTEIEYSFNPQNIFDAGNEFRNFDFSSLRSRSKNVSNIDFSNNENHVRLIPDKDRSKLPYSTVGDLNGYYYIRNERAYNNELESDYAWVHFYLPMDMRLDGSFYIWGELSDWYCNDQNKMKYDFDHNSYYLDLYLKQGFYDYMIMFKASNSNIITPTILEGNHSVANNSYNIFVYYRKPGNNYDSLIGYLRK